MALSQEKINTIAIIQLILFLGCAIYMLATTTITVGSGIIIGFLMLSALYCFYNAFVNSRNDLVLAHSILSIVTGKQN